MQRPHSHDVDGSLFSDSLVDSSVSEKEEAHGTSDEDLLDARPHDDRVLAAESYYLTSRISWLVVLLAFMLLTSYFVPFAVERMRYAWVRGKQQAEYEVAGQALSDLPFAQMSKAFQWVSQRVSPSVVHINVATPTMQQPAQLRMFGRNPRLPAGQGSGVIIDTEGYILTNRHVVRGSDEIDVRLSDGRTYPASVMGYDELTDLAVLKINADRLTAAEWGDSDDAEVGAPVWAVGSPFGLESSVTFGISSAKNRAGKAGNPYQDFLQTDAAVNPGNSGGALVDAHGQLIGINTAIVGDAYQGISFAIPSSVARKVYERLKRQEKVLRGWLGVEPVPVPTEMLTQLGLSKAEGAFVVRVVDDLPSPARKAGIREGDVIVKWGGTPIIRPVDLFSAVGDTDIGTTVEVELIRDAKPLTVNVHVVERPQAAS